MIASREALLVAIAGGDLGRHPTIQSITAGEPEAMVRHAQEIADAACRAWGHATTSKTSGCARCGLGLDPALVGRPPVG